MQNIQTEDIPVQTEDTCIQTEDLEVIKMVL